MSVACTCNEATADECSNEDCLTRQPVNGPGRLKLLESFKGRKWMTISRSINFFFQTRRVYREPRVFDLSANYGVREISSGGGKKGPNKFRRNGSLRCN